MRLFIWLTALACLSAAPYAAAQARGTPAALQLVATTADLASLAQAVGGERVAVSTLVPAGLDPEEYQPRPRDLERLRDARAVLRVGADYDLWLDRLLTQSRNPALARGGPGHIDASLGISLLDIRGATVGPGHPHGSGNPHYWLDPSNAEVITATVLEALARLDPAGARQYEQQRAAFLERLHARQRAWEAALSPYRGRALIAYHNSWPYFARRFRLNVAGFIELKPGVPPSAAHLSALLRTMREQHIGLIVRQAHEPARNAEQLARATGAEVLVLAASVGAVPQAGDYIGLLDYNVRSLAAAFARRGTAP
jgi:ABC-type Zn uptake system ZnuABC Zn-binding protein ZnuA